jgi:hypothetical protein
VNVNRLRGVSTALVLVIMMACSPMAANANLVSFCPADEEADIRRVLDFDDESDLELDGLLTRALSLGYTYEVVNGDNIPSKCTDVELVSEAITYKIYAGFDETNRFVRNYLVVADPSGIVRYIETRHSFRAPSFLN